MPLSLQAELTVLWSLLILVVVVTYLIQRHHWSWIPPASCAMIIGVFAGIFSRVIGAPGVSGVWWGSRGGGGGGWGRPVAER